MSKRETTQTTKTPTYVIACTVGKNRDMYRTQRHRWCYPMPGMNDQMWLKFPSRGSAEGYLQSQDFSAMDEAIRPSVRIEEIWL